MKKPMVAVFGIAFMAGKAAIAYDADPASRPVGR